MQSIVCPSGLSGVVRGLKVKDEQLFANKELARSGGVISKVISSCWEETLDPGPYDRLAITKNFSHIAAADRMFALIQVRILSYGNDYDFSVVCKSCGYRYMWYIDLSQLDFIPMAESGINQLKTGAPVHVPGVPSGASIDIRVATGLDEEFLAEQNIDEELTLTYNLARKIVQIDGKTDWLDILHAVEELPAKDADYLWDFADDMEGGLDTMFDVKCPKCKEIQRVILPFEASFFTSRKRFVNSRRKKRG
jgi:phage FluMu protein Com